jgi:hypothetical protein
MVAQEKTQATAAPCVKCGTTGGYIKKGCNRPNRIKGLCRDCYNHLYNSGRLRAVNNFLANPPAPTPIRPEVDAVPETVVERQVERAAEYRQRCRGAYATAWGVVDDAPPALASQDRIDLLVGRLARLEAEADNLALLMDQDRAELTSLRGVRA